jgi:hypothetical protein
MVPYFVSIFAVHFEYYAVPTCSAPAYGSVSEVIGPKGVFDLKIFVGSSLKWEICGFISKSCTIL